MILGGADIFPWPGGVVSAVHTEEDVETTAAAFKACLEMLARSRNRSDFPANSRYFVVQLSRLPVSKPRAPHVSKIDYRNIDKDPQRCGGQAIVAGTRIRVAVILGCYRQGMSIEEVLQQYPGLKPADVHDALAYAYDHVEEIEQDIAGDAEGLE